MSKMDKLLGQIKNAKGGSYEKDEHQFYYPARDAAKNGLAVIRFLSGKSDDAPYFVKTFSHGFKNAQGKWFIEECPTTIGKTCPVCESNGELVKPFGDWKNTPESTKQVVRQRKRKVTYITNILVVEDKKNPENEGKVFLFKFGEKIFNMIADKAQPEFEDETPMNAFDPETGCDFVFKIRVVDGQTNYDKSEFRKDAHPVGKEVTDQTQDLNQFVAESRFKTHDELQKRLDSVLGNTVRLAAQGAASAEGEVRQAASAAPATPKRDPKPVAAGGDDDDIMKMMREMAGEEGEAAKDDDIPF